MNRLFDTSVLIPAMLEEHPNHSASLKFIQKTQKKSHQSFIAATTLAECYATLTAMPLKGPIAPLQVEELLRKNLLNVFKIIPLTSQDYIQAIHRVAQKNLRSGIIFDALIVQAAVKKKIPELVTYNKKDFERLIGEDLRISCPDDFSHWLGLALDAPQNTNPPISNEDEFWDKK